MRYSSTGSVLSFLRADINQWLAKLINYQPCLGKLLAWSSGNALLNNNLAENEAAGRDVTLVYSQGGEPHRKLCSIQKLTNLLYLTYEHNVSLLPLSPSQEVVLDTALLVFYPEVLMRDKQHTANLSS